MDENIDNIVEQLKAESAPSISTEDQKTPTLTDDNVGDFVYDRTGKLVDVSLELVRSMSASMERGADSKEISALAQLIRATTSAVDTLNQINLRNKQDKNNIEVKKIEATTRSKIPSLPSTTNILIASQEEVLNKLNGRKGAKVDLIDNFQLPSEE